MRPKRQIRPKPAGTDSTNGAAGSSSSWASRTVVSRSGSSANLRSDGEQAWPRTTPAVTLKVQGHAPKDTDGTPVGQRRRSVRPAERRRGAARLCECGRRLAILWGLSATAALSFVASLHSSNPEHPTLALQLLLPQRRIEHLLPPKEEAAAESLRDYNYHYEETDDVPSVLEEAVEKPPVDSVETTATTSAAVAGVDGDSPGHLQPLQCCNYFAPRVDVGQVWCRRDVQLETVTPRPTYHTTAAGRSQGGGRQEEDEEVVVRTVWETVESLYQQGLPVRLPLPTLRDATMAEREEAEARAAQGATREAAAAAAHSSRAVGLGHEGGPMAFPTCSPAQVKHVRAAISQQALRAQPGLREAVRWRQGDVRNSKRAQTSTKRERRRREESRQDKTDWDHGFGVLDS